MKTSYHPILLNACVESLPVSRKLTAFAAGRKLYQFSEIPLGETNALPTIQRIRDDLMPGKKLTGAKPYLADFIVGGETRNEHEENLKMFFDASAKKP